MRFPGRLIRGPVRPDRGSLARFASLRWAALPIIDRRWTAPMSAVALGFGLFVGVAIGPGTEGSLGTSGPMVIRVPAPDDTQTALAPEAPSGGQNRGSGGEASDNGGDATAPPQPPATPPLDTTAPPPVSTPPPLTTPPPITTPPPVTTTPPTTTAPDTTTETTAEEPVETVTELSGTVVHLNPRAASYTIATEDGTLRAIHSHKPPGIGRQVDAEVAALVNGTYAEVGKRSERGRRAQVAFDGTVSFRDPITGAYTVSAPGVSVLVRGGAQRTPPEVGERVEVETRIADRPEELPVGTPGEQGCGKSPQPPKPPPTALEQVRLERPDAEKSTTAEIEAIVEGVCRETRRLIVSADDVREAGQNIAIFVPNAFRVAGLEPGQILKLGVEIGAGASLRLTGIAGDQGRKGAEDQDLVQPAD